MLNLPESGIFLESMDNYLSNLQRCISITGIRRVVFSELFPQFQCHSRVYV